MRIAYGLLVLLLVTQTSCSLLSKKKPAAIVKTESLRQVDSRFIVSMDGQHFVSMGEFMRAASEAKPACSTAFTKTRNSLSPTLPPTVIIDLQTLRNESGIRTEVTQCKIGLPDPTAREELCALWRKCLENRLLPWMVRIEDIAGPFQVRQRTRDTIESCGGAVRSRLTWEGPLTVPLERALCLRPVIAEELPENFKYYFQVPSSVNAELAAGSEESQTSINDLLRAWNSLYFQTE